MANCPIGSDGTFNVALVDVAAFDPTFLKQFEPTSSQAPSPAPKPAAPSPAERAPGPVAPQAPGNSGGGHTSPTDAPGLIACLVMLGLLALLAKRAWAWLSDRIPASLAQFIIVPPA
ncbi:MAG: hypothetical protein R2845_10255 [Thermomicrobiales bacterium]